MVFAVSGGSLAAIHRASYQAPTAIRLTDDLTQDYATIYRRQPAVRMVCDFLARNIAQLSLQTFKRVDDNDRERVTEHPFAKMMRKPNPRTTGYRLIFGMVADRAIYDRALWVKGMDENGRRMVRRIPPSMWRVDQEQSDWLDPTSFEIRGSRGSVHLSSEQVVYFRGYNPESELGGLSPIESLQRVLSEEYAAGQMREQILRNGARVSGYLERPAGAEWSDGAAARFKAGWRAQYQGFSASEAGGTPVLEDGMRFVPASQSAVDLQYIESRKLSREETAGAYFIPPPMVGLLEHATFGNITEQHKMLYQDTLGPWLQDAQQEIALQIIDTDFPEDAEELYSEFNMMEKLRGSFEEQAAQLQTSVGAPFLTRNEARARANLPRVEGGDDLVVPLNVLVDRPEGVESVATGALPGAVAEPVEGLTADDVVKLVNAAATLIRSGFDPESALLAVGLDPIKHLGLLPVTVQRPQEPENIDEEIVDALKSGTMRLKSRPSKPQVAKAEQVLASFFARQERVIKSALGAKAAEWWDADRWDAELAGDLFALSVSASTSVARKQLEAMGVDQSEFDEDRTLAWHQKVAADNAKSINTATQAAVQTAIDSDEDDAVAHVFDVAKDARASQAARTLMTAVAGFASVEAVTQVRGGRKATKSWLVNSANPRPSHAAMDGETVSLDEVFSNGAKWPGDSSALDVDEVAGCSCDVVIEFG